MSGGPDPLYVRARDALLDAADALTEQLRSCLSVLTLSISTPATPTPPDRHDAPNC